MDPRIKHLQVTSGSDYDPRGNPFPSTQYSYYVLTHGPFTDKYAKDQDTPEAVNAGFQKRIAHLQAVGAINSY